MSVQFHKRTSMVVIVMVGGIVTFGKNIVGALAWLYRFALTPQGSAAMQVGIVVGIAAILAVILVRR